MQEVEDEDENGVDFFCRSERQREGLYVACEDRLRRCTYAFSPNESFREDAKLYNAGLKVGVHVLVEMTWERGSLEHQGEVFLVLVLVLRRE